MSAKKTAQGIEVRKVPFEFPPDFQPHWHPADPAWMREWVALYDKGERGLAKLETSKLPQSPTGMLPA